MSTPTNIRRVAKDFAALCTPEARAENIYAKMLDDKLNIIYIMLIGPLDTPYEGGIFFFTIEPGMNFNPIAPEMMEKQYPYQPPRVLFHSSFSTRIHPNLYQPMSGLCMSSGGKVCLSILGTWPGPAWSASMTIIQTIFSIMDYAPLCNEPSYYNNPKADAVIKYTELIRHLIFSETIKNILAPLLSDQQESPQTKSVFMSIFSEEIKEYYKQNAAIIQDICKKRTIQYDQITITSSAYRISQHYTRLR